MGLSVEAYARQLKQLLPSGAAWPRGVGSRLSALLLGLAEELARVDARAGNLVDELDPRTTLELLPDFERVYGLPDECLGALPEAISERQVLVTQKAIAMGGQSRAFFIAVALTFGYVIEITEPAPHEWVVNFPDVELGELVNFRAGSRAGERLAGYAQLDIECILARLAPAHTVVSFTYT